MATSRARDGNAHHLARAATQRTMSSAALASVRFVAPALRARAVSSTRVSRRALAVRAHEVKSDSAVSEMNADPEVERFRAQVAVVDGGAPAGVALSNAARATGT